MVPPDLQVLFPLPLLDCTATSEEKSTYLAWGNLPGRREEMSSWKQVRISLYVHNSYGFVLVSIQD